MSEIEPRHNGPRCKCGEGVLIPRAYQQGMLIPGTGQPCRDHQRDRQSRYYAAEEEMLVCSATGENVKGWQSQVLRSWWAVGAHEQHMVDAKRLRGRWDDVSCAGITAALEAKARELCNAEPLLCGCGCGAVATCAEDWPGGQAAGDDCCDHQGGCSPLVNRDEALANLSAVFIQISEVTQVLLPEHDDAGEHFEKLATDCNSAIHGPAEPRLTKGRCPSGHTETYGATEVHDGDQPSCSECGRELEYECKPRRIFTYPERV